MNPSGFGSETCEALGKGIPDSPPAESEPREPAPETHSGKSNGMEWTMLVPLTEGTEVLWIDPPTGAASSLESVGPSLTVLSTEVDRPSSSQGEGVKVLGRPQDLSGSKFDVVIWERSPRGVGLEAVAEAVAPGGCLYYRIRGAAWGSWNPLGPCLRRLAPASSESRSPLVDFGSGVRGLRGETLGKSRRRLGELGFEDVQFFHPFPNHRSFHFVIPVDQKGVVDYFLSHLLPRKKRSVVLALEVARWVNRIGLYPFAVPVLGVFARRGD